MAFPTVFFLRASMKIGFHGLPRKRFNTCITCDHNNNNNNDDDDEDDEDNDNNDDDDDGHG